MYSLIRNALFLLPPEVAHIFALKALNTLSLFASKQIPERNLKTLMGLTFKNPLGFSAGLDQNAEYLNGLELLGPGFIEVGGVTPLAQPGNPKPRLFRIKDKEALINRKGFCNKGLDYLTEHLKKHTYAGIVGVNITKNKSTPNDKAHEDYLKCVESVYPYADYITINVSSPNTPTLRALQFGEHLSYLLKTLTDQREKLKDLHNKHLPFVVKIAPDISNDELIKLIETLITQNIEGVVATNTTVDHSAVMNYPHGNETGGLSGEPLFEKSLATVEKIKSISKDKLTIIGCGGINSPERAKMMLSHGADLIQLYTGLIYQGPTLIRAILGSLSREEHDLL